jgi:phosphotriesterase-related protein
MVAKDIERVELLHELVENGYCPRILLSQDTSLKSQLVRYGGEGYGHILRTIVPMLRETGISDNDIDLMLVKNPKRLMAYLQ